MQKTSSLVIATDAHHKENVHPDIEILRDALVKAATPATSVVMEVWDKENETHASSDSFKFIILRSVWDYFEKLGAFLEWVKQCESAKNTIVWNDYRTVLWNSHKKYIVELGEKVPVIPSVLITYNKQSNLLEHVEQVAKEKNWTSYVVKKCVSAGANGIMRSEDPKFAHHVSKEIDYDILVQPFIKTIQTKGELSLIFFEDEFSHAVGKVPPSGDYRVQEGHHERVEATPEQIEQAKAVLKACHETLAAKSPNTSMFSTFLYARVDFVFLENGSMALGEVELIEPCLYFMVGDCNKFVGNAVSAIFKRMERVLK